MGYASFLLFVRVCGIMITILCDTLKEGNIMSAIIAICGMNYCAFVADLRITLYDKNSNPIGAVDNKEKIFKINDNVLYGATGMFDFGETFSSPLEMFANFNGLTVTAVCSAVKEYMLGNLEVLKRNQKRTYLIGGKNSSGKFILRVLKYDAVNNRILQENYSSEDGIAICMALPSQAELQEERFRRMAREAVLDSKTELELVNNTARVIREIAHVDPTVSEKAMVHFVY